MSSFDGFMLTAPTVLVMFDGLLSVLFNKIAWSLGSNRRLALSMMLVSSTACFLINSLLFPERLLVLSFPVSCALAVSLLFKVCGPTSGQNIRLLSLKNGSTSTTLLAKLATGATGHCSALAATSSLESSTSSRLLHLHSAEVFSAPVRCEVPAFLRGLARVPACAVAGPLPDVMPTVWQHQLQRQDLQRRWRALGYFDSLPTDLRHLLL